MASVEASEVTVRTTIATSPAIEAASITFYLVSQVTLSTPAALYQEDIVTNYIYSEPMVRLYLYQPLNADVNDLLISLVGIASTSAAALATPAENFSIIPTHTVLQEAGVIRPNMSPYGCVGYCAPL